MKNKLWFQLIALILVFALTFSGVVYALQVPEVMEVMNINTVESVPAGTIDGIVLGPSTVTAAWVSAVGFENYGVATYHMGTAMQPFAAIYPYVDYIKQNHDLKYIVFDVHSLRRENLYGSVGDSHLVGACTAMCSVEAKFRTFESLLGYADRIYEYYGEPEDGKINRYDPSIYTRLLDIHGGWIDGFSAADRTVGLMEDYLGAHKSNDAFNIADMTPRMPNLDFEGYNYLDDFQKSELERVFEFCEEENLKVVFISIPSLRNLEIQQELTTILKYCSDRGYDTIDFGSREMFEEAGIDPTKDFYDDGHMNLAGGEKMTDYVCRFLVEKGYSTVDHRGEEGYEMWAKASENYFAMSKEGWQRADEKRKEEETSSQ